MLGEMQIAIEIVPCSSTLHRSQSLASPTSTNSAMNFHCFPRRTSEPKSVAIAKNPFRLIMHAPIGHIISRHVTSSLVANYSSI